MSMSFLNSLSCRSLCSCSFQSLDTGCLLGNLRILSLDLCSLLSYLRILSLDLCSLLGDRRIPGLDLCSLLGDRSILSFDLSCLLGDCCIFCLDRSFLLGKLVSQRLHLSLPSSRVFPQILKLFWNLLLLLVPLILLSKLAVGNRNFLDLLIHIYIEAVEVIAMLDKSNLIASQLLSAQSFLDRPQIFGSFSNRHFDTAGTLLED